MPNLPFSKEEVGQLIAYLKYVSAMNTEGWPPQVKVEQSVMQAIVAPAAAAPTSTAAAQSSSPAKAADPAARGAQLVKDLGCTACHSTGSDRVVGPGWGGLYDSTAELADGRKVKADDAYLVESIRQPNAKIVATYPPDVMPAYENTQISDSDIKAIVAYLHSLGTVK
jgi:mono/diheme cytochrome c family protein